MRSLDRATAILEGLLIILFLSLMVALTFLLVVFRALYTHSHIQWANMVLGQIDWTEPMVRLLVLWITFLGASLLTRDNKHIKIDLISPFLPPKWLPVREFILSVAGMGVISFMIKASFDCVRLEMNLESTLFMGIPSWVGQIILPAGFSVIFFRLLLRGVDQILKLTTGKGE